MSFLIRLFLLLACVAVALAIALAVPPFFLSLLVLLLAAVHALRVRSLRGVFARFAPVLLFAAGVYALQALAGTGDLKLSLRIVFLFAAVRLASSACIARGVAIPRQRLLYRLFLFAQFVRHFATILMTEAQRALVARRMAAPSLYSKSGLRSLAYALSGILERSLFRAERFYAAQLLRGLDA